MDKREAERHDAEIRALIKSHEAAWEAARKDYSIVAVSLGYELPEKRLTVREKKELKRRADKIVRGELLKLLKGQEINSNMRRLAEIWLLQQERGRGRPANKIRKLLIIQAVGDEYRKYFDPKKRKLLDKIGNITGLKIRVRRPQHKLILSDVGKRAGLGMERMKQLAPSGKMEFSRAVKRLARKRKRK